MRRGDDHPGWVLLWPAVLLLLAPPVAVGAASAGGGTSRPGPGPAATSSPADSWPVYLHDVGRSGADSLDRGVGPANVSRLGLDWKFPTKGVVVAQPVVSGDRTYVGSWDGNEYALNASTGAPLWATNLSTTFYANCSNVTYGVSSTASVVGGVVYVGSGAGWWYALRASNGSVLWRVMVANGTDYYNWASPLIHGGFAYVGIASACDAPVVRGALLQISLATHQVVHTVYMVAPHKRGGGIWGSPTYDPVTNSVFVTTGNAWAKNQSLSEAIVSLNATTLAVQSSWAVPADQVGDDSDFGTTPTLFRAANGTPLVGAVNKNGVFYALNRTNLSRGPLWSFRIASGGDCPECGTGSIAPAAAHGGFLFLAGGATTVQGTNFSGSVAKVVAGTGQLVWQTGLRKAVLGGVSWANGLVVVGSGPRLTVLSAANGTILFGYSVLGPIYGAASVVGPCAFFGSTDSNVYALSLPGARC